jgi:hypothetical protein
MKNSKWILSLVLGGLLNSLVACSGVSFTDASLTKASEDVVSDKTASESFYPNPADSLSKVDILFVIDNSASMQDEQLKLGDRLSSFVDSLKDVDWQIGITTTDTSSGPWGLKGSLLPLAGRAGESILTKNTPDYEHVFANTVVRPEGVGCGSNCPSVVERPLEATGMALAKGVVNGLIRPGAELAVVILSDSDEGGNGLGVITTPQMLLQTANLIFQSTKRITGFAIVVEPGNADCLSQERQYSANSFYGMNAALLAHLTGGVTGDICASDYAAPLKKIGERVLNLVSSLTLSKTPLDGTVNVKLTPADPSVQWSVNGNIIEFNKPPQPGTRVDVTYLVKED